MHTVDLVDFIIFSQKGRRLYLKLSIGPYQRAVCEDGSNVICYGLFGKRRSSRRGYHIHSSVSKLNSRAEQYGQTLRSTCQDKGLQRLLHLQHADPTTVTMETFT